MKLQTKKYINITLIVFTATLIVILQSSAIRKKPEIKEDAVLKSASQRIEKYRKGDFTIKINNKTGTPQKLELEINMISHKFLFGSNIFLLNPDDTTSLQKKYQEKFRQVFNYATLPFYWYSFEPEKGKKSLEILKKMALWCKENNITPKGHPLVWHESMPLWVDNDPGKIDMLLENRVKEIVSYYKGLIDYFDVINESTVFYKTENRYSEWVKEKGCEEAAALVFKWAREENEDGFFLINDFNIDSADYFNQIIELKNKNVKIDAVGIQSHMHWGNWTIEHLWEICEKYARLGIPIHFTEVTVLSGERINDKTWPSTPDGEKKQADYIRKFYTVLFSYPDVQAITWWDFSDYGAWRNAPAGLLRNDMSEKPAFAVLDSLINKEWKTKIKTETNKQEFSFRGFFGKYEIKVNGKTVKYFDFDEDKKICEINFE